MGYRFFGGIKEMLNDLEKETGLPCNPHTFRRTFASNLHRAGLDVEHIMRGSEAGKA